MNLAEIKDYISPLDPTIVLIDGKIQQKSLDGKYYYKFSGLEEFRAGVNYLSRLDFLDPIISQIKTLAVYRTSEDFVIVESSSQTDGLSRQLYHYILAIKQFLDVEVQDDNENALRIKLPPVQDFDDVARVMNDLKKAISIPISDEDVGGYVEIEKAESGSIWLLVALGTRKALRLVAELCWSAKVIQRKEKENEFVAQQVRDYTLSNDLKEALVDAQKQLVKQILANEASNIQNQFYQGQDPEQTQRLMLSIATISDLYHKGAEFRPSLSSPAEVSDLFPSNKNQEMIESRVKQLKEGNPN